MSSILPKTQARWLRHQLTEHGVEPLAIYVGGSRGGQVGVVPMHNSDLDALSVAAELPTSFSRPSTQPNGQKADLIARDLPSFAFDVLSAKAGGNATLLHLAAFSTILHSEHGFAEQLQQRVRALYTAGPQPITKESLAEELADCAESLNERSKLSGHQAKVAGLTLTHRFGRLALRAHRHWVANGKVIDRHLGQHLPEVQAQLARAHGEVGPLWRILKETLPPLHVEGPHAVPLSVRVEHKEEPSVAEAYEYAHRSPAAHLAYLRHPNREVRGAAEDWTHFMFRLTGDAVTAERYQKKPGEYQYALARHLNTLITLSCFEYRYNPDDCNLRDRIGILDENAPKVLAAVPLAMNGQPAALHRAAEPILERLVPEPLEFQLRPVPAHRRADPQTLHLPQPGIQLA